MVTAYSRSLGADESQLADFCRRHAIRRLAVFGSVLVGQARPQSDLDLLVEFERGVRVGLIRLAGIELELSVLLGRTADLRTAADLSPHFRQRVLDEAEALYERS